MAEVDGRPSQIGSRDPSVTGERGMALSPCNLKVLQESWGKRHQATRHAVLPTSPNDCQTLVVPQFGPVAESSDSRTQMPEEIEI